MRLAPFAAALINLVACTSEPVRITAIQSAQATDFVRSLGRCDAARRAPVNIVVLGISGQPAAWYARIGLMTNDYATLNSGDDIVYYADLLEGSDRAELMARGAFNEDVLVAPRTVVVCCPQQSSIEVPSETALSVSLEYIRQTQRTTNTVRAVELAEHCEVPEVMLSPIPPEDYIIRID